MSAANEDSIGVDGIWGGNSVGGHMCSHQTADGPFLGRNLRHREGVSSNYYLPAMHKYLGFSIRLPISRQGESGHCNPLSLPTQLGELKEYLLHLLLSLPPSSRVLLIHCTPCSVVKTTHWEAAF